MKKILFLLPYLFSIGMEGYAQSGKPTVFTILVNKTDKNYFYIKDAYETLCDLVKLYCEPEALPAEATFTISCLKPTCFYMNFKEEFIPGVSHITVESTTKYIIVTCGSEGISKHIDLKVLTDRLEKAATEARKLIFLRTNYSTYNNKAPVLEALFFYLNSFHVFACFSIDPNALSRFNEEGSIDGCAVFKDDNFCTTGCGVSFY
jgi:hypothetical protein